MVRFSFRIGKRKAKQREEQEEAQAPAGPPATGEKLGFRQRGRMRRRLRFLRKARELAYRDLGGLTFTLYRFGGKREELMAVKLERLAALDKELRALERALGGGEPFTVLREAGVVACPRCAEIHSAEDRYCPHCGLAVSPQAERPLRTDNPQREEESAARPAAQPPNPALEETRSLGELELERAPRERAPEQNDHPTRILPPQEGEQRP